MSRERLTVLIAGGGTGGHLYPGLAVARELLRRRPDAVVSFAGTARGIEARVIPATEFTLDVIRSAGLKGKSLAARLRGAATLLPSLLDAWRLVSKRRPSVVVGVGGYSSGPVVLVAALRSVPTMVLEQNAAPGLTNRLLARVVRAAAVTYEESVPHFFGKAIVTGNPARAEFFAVADRPATSTGRHVLILGGSQGAHAINMAFVAAAAGIAGRVPGLTIAHQTGVRDLDAVCAAYAAAGIAARAEAFFDPVVDEVAKADLVICRAGATTLAELAAAGRPAVLVPFAAATDDHQKKNAMAVASVHAAMMIEEHDLGPARLTDAVASLLLDPDALGRMRQAMRGLAKPAAATAIAQRIEELAS
jgi:UDP-N-acetylglucosamine--N-acetylmuramyl-(pentapeptide) pyrophosphoryl-undecaprenol N-acetylglucosamine transferase